jgi:four helix bundle protein
MEIMNPEQRIDIFKATDSFAIEAYSTSRKLKGGKGNRLAAEIRRTAVESGGAVVAASASEPGGELERRHLQRARSALIESRYYLYLARRFGLLELHRYRVLASRQDAALRELESFLRPSRGIPGPLESPILR